MYSTSLKLFYQQYNTSKSMTQSDKIYPEDDGINLLSVAIGHFSLKMIMI